jgi:hypothetical protein
VLSEFKTGAVVVAHHERSDEMVKPKKLGKKPAQKTLKERRRDKRDAATPAGTIVTSSKR